MHLTIQVRATINSIIDSTTTGAKNNLKGNLMKSNISAAIIWLMISTCAWANNIESQVNAEINNYIRGLQSSSLTEITRTADQISASGLSDKRLYNAVQSTLMEKHNQQLKTPKDKALIPVVISLLRALASSGSYNYQPAINQVLNESESRASRNRAKHVLTKISWYAKRNKIMQDMSHHESSQSVISSRYLNMLNHADMNMNRYAAEELYRLGSAEDVVVQRMWSAMQSGTKLEKGKLHTDVMAWYCRAIVKLAKNDYQERIEELVNGTSVHKKIRKHCRKELSR